MSFLKNPCTYCDCKEFVANPWKEEKCINCYHPHGVVESKPAQNGNHSTANAAPPKPKTLYTKTTMRNLTGTALNAEKVSMSSSTSPNALRSTQSPMAFKSASHGSLPIREGPKSPKSPVAVSPQTSHGSLPVRDSYFPGTTPGSRGSMPNKENMQYDLASSKELLKNTVQTLQRMTTTSKNSYREKVVRELIETEQTYVKGVQTLIEYFLVPLRKDSKGGKNIEHIFNNIEEILQINSVLLKNLHERLDNWSNDSTKIGDVILDVGPYLKPYYTKYTEGYAGAQNLLKESEKSSTFAAFLEDVQSKPEAGGLTIRAFLILPIQRIPRYTLLLADLVKHTPPEHPDFAQLNASLEKMKQIANSINTAIKQGENRQKIIHIQESFVSTKLNFVEPHRVFIRDGPLMKVCRKTLKQRWFFLFNDMIVYGSVLKEGGALVSNNKYIYHGVFNLNQVRLDDLSDKAPTAFQFVTPVKSFVVHASSPEEKMDWMVDVCNAIDEWKARTATLATESKDKKAEFEAPVWVPDDQVSSCAQCTEKFTMLKRRHHCRACGACVCGNCSNKKVVLPGADKEKVRVCTTCYAELTKDESTPTKE